MLCCGVSAEITSPVDGIMNDLGLTEIINSIHHYHTKSHEKNTDLVFLQKVLQNQACHSLIKMHQTVKLRDFADLRPEQSNAVELIGEVTDMLMPKRYLDDAKELLSIFKDNYFEALTEAHDKVATKEFSPILPIIPYEVDEDEGSSVKIIKLLKNPAEPLGAEIVFSDEKGFFEISSLSEGGAADRCGLINVGDRVIEINGENTANISQDEVRNLLGAVTDAVTLTLIPSEDDIFHSTNNKKHVRPLFNYDATDDKDIPCGEIGLSFKFGDILQVTSEEDSMWWRARIGENQSQKVGLIPSEKNWEQRKKMRNSVQCSENSTKHMKSVSIMSKGLGRFSPKFGKKIKKNKRNTQQSEQQDAQTQELDEETRYYEVVERIYSTDEMVRPIILTGSFDIPANDIKLFLCSNESKIGKNNDRERKNPCNNENFIIVSDCNVSSFNKTNVCFEEHEIDPMMTISANFRKILEKKKICISFMKPKVIKQLRCRQLKPYIILIQKSTAGSHYSKNKHQSKVSLNNDEHTVESPVIVRTEHYFDEVINYENLEILKDNLYKIIVKVLTQPQWICASWII